MKEEIIIAAIRQLRLGGYENLSFAAIADELGTTRANLHHHFKNKEGLAAAAVEQYIANDKRMIDGILSAHVGDLRGLLKALEDHILFIVLGLPEETGCLGSQLIRDSAAPERLRRMAIKRFQDESNDIAREVAEHFRARGVLKDADTAEAIAFRVSAMFHGLNLMGLIEPDKQSLAQKIHGSLTSLLP